MKIDKKKSGKIFGIFRDKNQFGGQALVKKQGRGSVEGTGKIFAAWRDPPVPPPGKKLLLVQQKDNFSQPDGYALHLTHYAGSW